MTQDAERTLMSFDWAMKSILRDKANFDVLEGFLTTLLEEEITVISLLESEGNQQHEQDKYNRVDLAVQNAKGEIIIVEIKCARADLLGDQKWTEYLDYCDRYFWAVPAGFDYKPIEQEGFLPERTGLIIADAYDAEIARPAALVPLAAARRKVETQRLARLAMRRLMGIADPDPVLAKIEAE